ncbi:hypothetical protein ACWDE0_37555 [Streptomyces sp. 900105755]
MQLFTGPNYTGNCLEYSEHNLAEFLPSGFSNNVSSERAWGPYSIALFNGATHQEFDAGPYDWWPTLPSWIDNQAQWINTTD